MLRVARVKKSTIGERWNRAYLEILFGDEAVTGVLRFIEDTGMGRRLAKDRNRDDSWDIEPSDQSADEEDETLEDGKENGGR
jgi:hypothetical protein